MTAPAADSDCEFSNHSQTSAGETVHDGVTCHFCEKTNIRGIRYKCLQCAGGHMMLPQEPPVLTLPRCVSHTECNRCNSCMTSPKAWKSHYATHQFFPIETKENLYDYTCVKDGNFTDFVHQLVTCDGCGTEDIVGARNKCLICASASSHSRLVLSLWQVAEECSSPRPRFRFLREVRGRPREAQAA